MLPIVVGIGATIAAFMAKTTISTYRKYILLTPELIASLNNIRVPIQHAHHEFLTHNFDNAGFNDKMTEQEALRILGIAGDDILHVNRKMVRDRFRKLVVMNHPDRGGSKYLSQKINEAKGVLDKSPLVNEPK